MRDMCPTDVEEHLCSTQTCSTCIRRSRPPFGTTWNRCAVSRTKEGAPQKDLARQGRRAGTGDKGTPSTSCASATISGKGATRQCIAESRWERAVERRVSTGRTMRQSWKPNGTISASLTCVRPRTFGRQVLRNPKTSSWDGIKGRTRSTRTRAKHTTEKLHQTHLADTVPIAVRIGRTPPKSPNLGRFGVRNQPGLARTRPDLRRLRPNMCDAPTNFGPSARHRPKLPRSRPMYGRVRTYSWPADGRCSAESDSGQLLPGRAAKPGPSPTKLSPISTERQATRSGVTSAYLWSVALGQCVAHSRACVARVGDLPSSSLRLGEERERCDG